MEVTFLEPIHLGHQKEKFYKQWESNPWEGFLLQ